MPLSDRQLIRDVAGERTIIEIDDDSNYRACVEIERDGERWELGIDRERVAEVLDRDATEVCPEWLEAMLQELGVQEVQA